MKNGKKNINNIDQLEKEIYRLKYEARKKEDILFKQLDYFRENYASMSMNSFFNRTKKESPRGSMKERFLNNITDKLADKAINGIETLFKRYFNNGK